MRHYGAIHTAYLLIALDVDDTIDIFEAHATLPRIHSKLSDMPRSLTIDASPVLGHFRKLKEYGVPSEELEKTLGMSEDELRIQDARVPVLNNFRMIEKGIALIGADIALRLGTAVSLEQMGVCGHIFANCQNIDEATDQFIRYQRLLHAVSSFSVTKTERRVIISHAIMNPVFRIYNRLAVELAFSGIVSTIRNLMQDDFIPLEVQFTHERPDYVTRYVNIFRSPLLFNQKADRIIFERMEFHKALPKSHVYVKDVLIQHADGLLRDLKDGGDLINDVKKLVMQYLSEGNVDIEMISRKLNMSRWTLTRKLKKEGTTFKSFVTELRKELSLNYLQNEKLSVSEIAFLLGYSEISTFRRAFKDWTGKNPNRYRQELKS
jgi:AraC-like DNA-binding protein